MNLQNKKKKTNFELGFILGKKESSAEIEELKSKLESLQFAISLLKRDMCEKCQNKLINQTKL